MATNKQLRLLSVGSDIPSPPAPSTDAFSFDPELVAGYYVLVPGSFLRSPDFGPIEKVLYSLLLYYASTGARYLPNMAVLAEECAVRSEEIDAALAALLAAKLVTYQEPAAGSQALYHLNCHDASDASASNHPNKVRVPDRNLHIPQDRTHPSKNQIHRDVRILVEKVGISEEAARSLAQLAAERGCSEGYVAGVVEYALTTPSIKNPAGCVVELIRRNESRRPPPQAQQQDNGHGLDPEKYTTGKYAFLFRRGMGEGNAQDKQPEGEGAEP